MKKRLIIFFMTAILAAGCASTANVGSYPGKSAGLLEINKPEPHLTVGERFTFVAAWKGIHVGTATAAIEDMVTLEGHKCYKIVVIAETTPFLSKLFKVEDKFISYMDAENLVSRRFEATIREGRYKKDLVVDYDTIKGTAVYKNLRDGSVKICAIERDVHDPVSAAYFFRTIPVTVGDRINIAVNHNEKNYEVSGNIEKRSIVNIAGVGSFDAFLVRPYLKLKGRLERRGTAWGYLSSDKRRVGLYMVVRVLEIPWIGDITATLTKIEYL